MAATSTVQGTDQASLRVQGMRIGFKNPEGESVIIIDDISFDADPGSMVCLSGRSGSGKSSIIKQLVGVMPALPGVISWNDEDISNLDVDELAVLRRTLFSYVDQASGLVEHLTALENVLLPFIPYGKAAVQKALPAAKEVLSSLGMSARVQWKSSQLSGGEKQRVAVARAICVDTPALVIDEPTASLDRSSADTVIAQLRKLSEAGKTVIVASHDPKMFAAADRVIQLEQ